MKKYAQTNVTRLVLLAVTSILAGQAAAAQHTLYVTNDGSDSVGCGARTSPCRSISQAIENASPGDAIAVGAGRYGNISGDGTFSHPGDEHPQLLNLNGVTGCMICITKPLHIFSLHGPSVTSIEGIPGTEFGANVLIASYGVRFGGDGYGFTLTGRNAYGVLIDQNNYSGLDLTAHALGARILVEGNVDIGDATGFGYVGLFFQNHVCNGAPCSADFIQFSSNRAVDNSRAGFSVVVNQDWSITAGPIVLRDNIARGSATGFNVQAGQQDLVGRAVSAANVSLLRNIAIQGGFGFNTDLAGSMLGNTATGNSVAGFLVVPNGSFRGNSAIGNAGPGLIVNFSADGFDDANATPRSFNALDHNNFYGNDRSRPQLIIEVPPAAQLDTGPSAHCGILNVGAVGAIRGPSEIDPTPKEVLVAPNNYWGAATGPAPQGAADAVGGACDQNHGVTTAPAPSREALGITASPSLL